MLNRVHFENIRALADLTLDLSQLTVLVGRNACGKSTVLDEIERLCAMSCADGEPQSNVMGGPGRALSRGALPPRTYGGTGPTFWSGTAGTTRLEVRLEVPGERPWFQNLTVTATTEGTAHILGPLGKDVAPPDPARVALNEVLADSFSWRAQRLSLERRMILEPSPVDAPLDGVDPSGFGLPTLLLHLGANEPDAYAALQHDMSQVVPGFKRIYVKKVDLPGNRYGYALDLVIDGAGRIPAEMTSEGTLFTLGLLTAIHASELPRIILLDDLDRGLHLSAQYQIVQAIRRVLAARPDVQVICTSHAPVLVDSFQPDEVRILAKDTQGHTVARPLTELPEFARWSGSLQAGELWASFGEEWVLGHG